MSDPVPSLDEMFDNSVEFLTSLFLHHPETGEKMVVVSAYEEPETAEVPPHFVIIVSKDPNSDEAIAHTVMSRIIYAEDDLVDAEPELVDIDTKSDQPKVITFPQGLVGLDGKPLKS